MNKHVTVTCLPVQCPKTSLFHCQRLLIIAGFSDGAIGVWNATAEGTPALVADHQAHEGAVVALLPVPGTHRFLSGSLDGTLRLWEVGTADCQPDAALRQVLLLEGARDAKATPRYLTHLSAQNQVVSSWTDGRLRAWDLERATLVWTLGGLPSDAAPQCVTCWAEQRDDLFVAACSRSGTKKEPFGQGFLI